MHLNDFTLDHHALGAGVAAVGELSLRDPNKLVNHELARPDLVLFNAYGMPIKVIEYKTGVSQKKKARFQLKRAQEMLYSIFQEKPRMIYVCGTPNSGFKLEEILQ